jgi:hypothetical protein
MANHPRSRSDIPVFDGQVNANFVGYAHQDDEREACVVMAEYFNRHIPAAKIAHSIKPRDGGPLVYKAWVPADS